MRFQQSHTHLPVNTEPFMLPSSEKYYENANFFCSRSWHVPTMPKISNTGSVTKGVIVLDSLLD